MSAAFLNMGITADILVATSKWLDRMDGWVEWEMGRYGIWIGWIGWMG